MTYNLLKRKLEFRPFIITRSANLAAGKYTGHWLGDNYSNYKSMRNSVDGIFQFMIYGITMTGDDICGFFDDGDGKLCNRWYNLGAFYPFCRNHNFNLSPDHYPWSYDEQTLDNIRNAINTRYMILRYIYSHLFAAHLNEKVGFFNPVFFYYPNDPESYNNMNEKIMIGDAFILFPIFTNETSNINRTFPPGRWHYFPSGKILINETDNRTQTLSGELDKIHFLSHRPLNLMINPDENKKAKGLIFLDNDEVNTIDEEKYFRIELDYDNGFLKVNTKSREDFIYNFEDNKIRIIEILGGGEHTSCLITINIIESEPIIGNMEYDENNDKFSFKSENKDIFINEIKNIEFEFS